MKFSVLLLFFVLLLNSTFSLEIHSQTLIERQRGYDAMKQRIASTTVDLPCLDADKKRAQYIKSIVYEKLKELDSALTVTANYKQAEQKYFELLRLFEDDPEVSAIRSNYKDFKEAESLRMGLVKKNSLTLEEFESWKKKVLQSYKSLNGANFNERTEEFNSISEVMLNL